MSFDPAGQVVAPAPGPPPTEDLRPRLPPVGPRLPPVGPPHVLPAAVADATPATGTPALSQPTRTSRSRRSAKRPHSRRPSGSAGGELLRALLFPGVSTIRRVFVLGVLLAVIGIVFPLFILAWILAERHDLLALAIDDRFLLAVMVGAASVALARLVAISEVALFRQRHQSVGVIALGAYAALAVLTIPMAFSVYSVAQARTVFDGIFVPARTALFVPPAGMSAQFDTVLLLGTDGNGAPFEGPTESMFLATIHRSSGRVAAISIPSGLQGLRFPPNTVMAARFPAGFSGPAGEIHRYVKIDESVQSDFVVGTFPPAEIAVVTAVGHSFDVQIDDYLFVDMAGFADLVDVLGGITTSAGGNSARLDGPMTVAYVTGTESDLARMERQIEVLAALNSQASVFRVMTRINQVADATAQAMRTSSTRDDFAALVAALTDSDRVVRSIGLEPPEVQPDNPDFARIREVVADVRSSLASGDGN